MKLKKRSKPSSPKSPHSDVGGISLRYSKFPGVSRPSFIDRLKFPDDITELSSHNVSDLHGKYTLLWTYVNQDIARLNVRLLRLHQQESSRQTAVYHEDHRILNCEKWKRDVLMDSDEELGTIRQAVSSAEAELKMAQMFADNYDRYINALSRELTRKMHEHDLNRRG